MKRPSQLSRGGRLCLLLVVTGLVLAVSLGWSGQRRSTTLEPMVGLAKQAIIASPCEGFFLASEYPGEEPLVKVGSLVSADTTVAYVQSMERHAVLAGVNGTIVEVMVADMVPVGAGDPLFRVALAD